ncbi:hypothetical protein NS331_16520 [Pseudacidovorax intermedius]|uniref:HK97 gp10 family phage protein n=1 Tax=Pseudacidovorax intermedius TaxID=433924 RepID=A0A147GR00_9BURK|nr:hypothetical protein NS331_16520 [Pseudacidovorax intermedius]
MPQFVTRTEQRGARGVAQALVLGAAEASVMTPIDTSNLLNSQYRDVSKHGKAIVGRVGYTAEHALPVHDPEHKQQFRRATAKKEFLKKGFEKAEPNIRGVITGAIRV